jgi:hypothetical protein
MWWGPGKGTKNRDAEGYAWGDKVPQAYQTRELQRTAVSNQLQDVSMVYMVKMHPEVWWWHAATLTFGECGSETWRAAVWGS